MSSRRLLVSGHQAAELLHALLPSTVSPLDKQVQHGNYAVDLGFQETAPQCRELSDLGKAGSLSVIGWSYSSVSNGTLFITTHHDGNPT